MYRTLVPLVLLLSGCASLAPDGSMDRVAALTRERTGQTPQHPRDAAAQDSRQARVSELLRTELSADHAVELALLQQPGLQARFAALGVADSERVRAGRLANPVFEFGRLREGGGALEIERALVFNLLGLLTLPAQQQLAQQRFTQAQLETAAAAVAHARQVRDAWTEAVAAQQLLHYHLQVQEVAAVATELAQRMMQTGNLPALAQLREQAFRADASADLARARHRALAARAQLEQWLGLDAAQQGALQLPERLPELPATLPELTPEATAQAVARRLDVQAAQQQALATAGALGLRRSTGFVDLLELGVHNQSRSGAPRATGWQAAVTLPVFDLGQAGRAGAEAQWAQAVHAAADVALQARTELRESASAYRTAHALARHWREEVVPLRQRIAEQQLLRYNGMLVGVFELLADAREQVRSVAAAVETQREAWLAEHRLRQAMAIPPAGPTAAARSAAPAASSATGHAGH